MQVPPSPACFSHEEIKAIKSIKISLCMIVNQFLYKYSILKKLLVPKLF